MPIPVRQFSSLLFVRPAYAAILVEIGYAFPDLTLLLL